MVDRRGKRTQRKLSVNPVRLKARLSWRWFTLIDEIKKVLEKTTSSKVLRNKRESNITGHPFFRKQRPFAYSV
jgi:hypothetical protein